MYRRTRYYLQRTALLCAALASAGTAIAQVVPPPSRGQLLYSTHCLECHDPSIPAVGRTDGFGPARQVSLIRGA